MILQSDPTGARQAAAGRPWIVVHETGAPSHYAGLKAALAEQNIDLQFVELNFWGQAKVVIRGRVKGQWRKTLVNLCTLAGFAFSGARGRQVVLGLAPYNPWVLVVRWLLRHATLSIHLSWPFWDGSRQPHEPLLPGVLDAWQTFMNQQVSHVLIATEAAKRSLQASPYGRAPITVVAHSYDKAVFRANQDLHHAPQRFAYVGRLEPTKGVDLMLEIAERLPHKEFVFIGGGPLASFVEAAASRLSNVRFLGLIADRSKLGDELRRCQVLLLPSIRVPTWEEAFGMVLVEGMACGLVPLTTDHVGPVEVLGEQLGSLCFTEAGFVDGVCRQIQRWDAAPEEFRRHQVAARELAEPYVRERIASRWSVALGIGTVPSSPAELAKAPQGAAGR